MKILHILEDYSLNSGGIRTVVKNLDDKLKNIGYESYIIAPEKESGDDIFLVNGSNNPWRYSKQWKIQLSNIHKELKIDVIHLHGVWMYPQFIGARFAIKNHIPFVISPHGMYEPWLWTKGTLKKKLYFNLIVKNIFNKASLIHTITPQESDSIKGLFPKLNTFEIPNLIDSNLIKTPLQTEPSFQEKYILYLGRLDPKKGLDILIQAFSKLKTKNIKLKIAGKINNYKKTLENLIDSLPIEESSIEFLGMVTGKKKYQLYQNAFVFVAPSYSEVIGMVNLEAALLKTPVITTYQTGLDLSWNENGGKLINPTTEELTNALNTFLSISQEERINLGNKLHNFVLKKYSWENRINDWEELYNKCIENV